MEAAPVRSLLLCLSYLLDEDGETVVAVVAVERIASIAIAIASVGWKNVIVRVVDRSWNSSGDRGGQGDLVNWGRGLEVSQAASSGGLEGGEELGLGSSNVSGIVKELVRDLFSLDIIVYRRKSSMLASKCCVECGLELCLGEGNLGGVLKRSSGSYGNNKDLELRHLHLTFPPESGLLTNLNMTTFASNESSE